jgi:hypothetical protein
MNSNDLLAIGVRLRTQDNRCTADPMFCVQEKRRDIGYDKNYSDDTVWIDMSDGDYDEVEPNTPGAEEFGYKDRFETVMVAFTQGGCRRVHQAERAQSQGRTAHLRRVVQALSGDDCDTGSPDGQTGGCKVNQAMKELLALCVLARPILEKAHKNEDLPTNARMAALSAQCELTKIEIEMTELQIRELEIQKIKKEKVG